MNPEGFVKEMERLHGVVLFDKSLSPNDRDIIATYFEAMTNIDTPEKLDLFEKICSCHYKPNKDVVIISPIEKD